MKNIKVTLPDNSIKNIAQGATPQDVAEEIGSGLARAVVVSKVNGELKDLNFSLQSDCSLELFTGDTPEGHDTLLHSTAHLMAQAVKELFPEAKVTIGPTIENGFYYDFDVDAAFSDEVLVQIEKKMKELAKSSQEIFRSEISAKDAVTLAKNWENYSADMNLTEVMVNTGKIVVNGIVSDANDLGETSEVFVNESIDIETVEIKVKEQNS